MFNTDQMLWVQEYISILYACSLDQFIMYFEVYFPWIKLGNVFFNRIAKILDNSL